MGNPGAGLLRVGRAAMLAVCCGALALLGHISGGAAAPPLSAFVTVTALIGAAFAVLAGRRRQFRHILVVSLGAQVAFHLAFYFTSTHSTMAHGALSAGSSLGGSPGGGWAAIWDPVAVAGHAGAAVVLSALVAHGEDLVWALYHLLGLVRLPSLGALTVLQLTQPLPVQLELAQPGERLWARVHPRRGPPDDRVG